MWLVYDVETNDMPRFNAPADAPGQARIIQLAAILTDDKLNPVAEMTRIAKPDGSWVIAPGAFGAHGISFERCQDEGVPIAAIVEQFDTFAEQAEGVDGTLVAFNIRFDNKLIRGERRRLGRADRFGLLREFDPMKESTSFCKLPPTPAMVRAGRNNYKSPKLIEAVEVLCGYKLDGAHDAMADVRGTLDVLRWLRDHGKLDIRGLKPESIQAGAEKSPASRAPARERGAPETEGGLF